MPTGCADHSAANLPSAHCDLDELPHITMELALCTNDEGCFLINGIWHCSYVVEVISGRAELVQAGALRPGSPYRPELKCRIRPEHRPGPIRPKKAQDSAEHQSNGLRFPLHLPVPGRTLRSRRQHPLL